MERLTIDEAIKHAREVAKDKRADADWKWIHGRLNSDDCISCAEEHEQLADWLEKLKAYEQAEEDGLLIRLPCNAGDIIYRPSKSKGILEFQIVKIEIYEDEMIYIDDGDNVLEINDFGRRVFLTKAEAEQALAKMKGEA